MEVWKLVPPNDATPVVPPKLLGTTELAPTRKNCPLPNPNELMARFSKLINGVVMVTGVARACAAPRKTAANATAAARASRVVGPKKEVWNRMLAP